MRNHLTSLLRRRARRRPLSTALVALLASAIVGAMLAQASGWFSWAVFDMRVRAIGRTPASGRTRTVTWDFPFRSATRTVTVGVDESYLAAARALRTSDVFAGEGILHAAFVSSLVHAEADGPFVGKAAAGFRRLKSYLRLDDDEYVELITRAVQSIPYGTPEPEIGLPVEVLVDRRAVCTDKSILLAALLLHEGYDAAIWDFPSQRHVAAGVRGNAGGMRGTGYAFLETTRPSYVNEVGEEYAGIGPTTRPPQLIALGGMRVYSADAQSTAIADALSRQRDLSRILAPYGELAVAATGKWRGLYAGMARQHEDASQLAAALEALSDDRPAAYELLTGGDDRGR
jgi:hypothetical protein